MENIGSMKLQKIQSLSELKSDFFYIFFCEITRKLYIVKASPEYNSFRQMGDVYGEKVWYLSDNPKGDLWGPLILE